MSREPTSDSRPMVSRNLIKWARVGWIVVVSITLVLSIWGFSNWQNEELPHCTVLGAECPFFVVSREDVQLAQEMGLPTALTLLLTGTLPFILVRVCYLLLSFLLFWRRPDDWVAWMFSFSLVGAVLEQLVEYTGMLKPLALILLGVSGGAYILLPFVFPNGRFEPPWTRWIVIPLAVISVAFPEGSVRNFNLNISLWSVVAPLGIYALVYRYRRVSTATERQQTRWAVMGMLVGFVTLLLTIGIGSFYPAARPAYGRVIFLLVNGILYPGSGVVLLAFFTIAIVRYRLWDIDILIRRTLQYSLLTGLLALTYFGSVILLQTGFRALTGQTNSPIITVLSTLGIAGLFTPLRNRVQEFIDRRFYRKKYNAEQALAKFAAIARDEVDMDKLTAALLEVVQETMQPEKTLIWLVNTKER
ncbi:MAG: hypothetical protein HUU38_23885, partial [Anaerolineales bacterium]|nr:hypothetical protein [Anaerolineales bacterium]